MKIEYIHIERLEAMVDKFFDDLRMSADEIVKPPTPEPYKPVGKLTITNYGEKMHETFGEWFSVGGSQMGAVHGQDISTLRRYAFEHEIGVRAIELLRKDQKLNPIQYRVKHGDFLDDRDAILAALDPVKKWSE
jgi:hypothetical protein